MSVVYIGWCDDEVVIVMYVDIVGGVVIDVVMVYGLCVFEYGGC